MQIKEILNSKRIEELEKLIENNYGVTCSLKDFGVIITHEDKIWITTKEASELVNSSFNVNSIGMYIGKLKRGDKINMSIEGIQMFAKNAIKNFVIVDEKTMKEFMMGYSIGSFEKVNCEMDNFVLVKYKDDFIGVGVFKGSNIENLLPKSRRIY